MRVIEIKESLDRASRLGDGLTPKQEERQAAGGRQDWYHRQMGMTSNSYLEKELTIIWKLGEAKTACDSMAEVSLPRAKVHMAKGKPHDQEPAVIPGFGRIRSGGGERAGTPSIPNKSPAST